MHKITKLFLFYKLMLLLFCQVIYKHFYLRRDEVLSQCYKWKKDLLEGVAKLRSQGTSVATLMDYLKTLVKQIEVLKTTLSKIDSSQFEANE